MSMDADCVKVAVRIRPLVKSEIERGCQNVIEKVPGIQQVVVKTNDAFTFNYVFSVDDTQQFVYEKAVFGMLEKLFNGYNVTILAYGQTGSGKTHTMGTAFSGKFDIETGVIPRAVNDIFKKISSLNGDYTATVTCSFVELYQEQLYDLLSTSSREQSVVDIREDGNRGIIMPGLTESPVNSAQETTDCLMKGSSGRAVGATAMNSQSSRSHAIFTINIQMTHNTDSNRSTSSKFHLVDLAGSERAQKTKATGDRFKEGVKINQGLLALGNVISALGSGQNNGYVGYRDSKLTRLLQDSLGGNSVTLMIACVSPADYNFDETLSTLRYADRARKIKNKPIVNQDPKAAEINKLNGIIQKLRMELLAKGTGSGGDVTINNQELDTMRKNLNNLIEKNQMLQQQLQTTLHDVAEIEMRATFAETAQEELQNKLLEVKDLVKTLNSNLDANSCPAEFVENSQNISKLKEFFGEVDEILEKTRIEMLNHKSSSTSNGTLNQHGETTITEVVQQKLEAFNSKQLNFNNELRKLNQELKVKQQHHERVVGNLSKFCTYEGETSEEKIKEYESMIQILEAEKTELCGKLKNMKGAASAKIAEERRLRLQQLEQQINEMRKKNMQQSKMLKMREKESQKIENLNREIQAMKAAKVKLIRAMKAESEHFRQWKLNRERELTVLKEKDKKQQHEMIKMESLQNRQRNVLKRKVEEAMAINKRLKDALDKQKSAQSHKKQAASGKIEQTIAWVDQELEIILSVIDAKYSLEQLMEDRAIINKRLKTLKDDVSDNHKQEISSLEEDLQMRNAQINDLQQKIIASDIDSKMNGLCDGMTSMPQARGVLKHLLTALSDLRKEHARKESKIDEFRSACETAEEKIQNLQKDIEAMEDNHREELSNVEKTYEEKISVLLRELNTVPQVTNGEVTPEMDQRLKIQQETLDKLDNLREELENYKKLCAQLEEAVKKPKMRKIAVKQEIDLVPVEEFFTVSEEEDEDEDSESTKDPDWKKTPRFRRANSRNSREDKNTTKLIPIKRSSDGSTRCSCKTKCSTLECSCKKNSTQCSENCKCSSICINRWNSKDENDSQQEIDVKQEIIVKQEIEEESIQGEEHTPKKIKHRKISTNGEKAAVTAVEGTQANVVDSTSEVKIVVEPAVVEAKDKKGAKRKTAAENGSAESTTVPVKRGRGRPKKKQDTSDVDGNENENETKPRRSPRKRTPVESYAEEADEEEEEERQSLKPPKRGRGKPVKTAGAKKMLAEQSKGRKRGSGADSKNEESSENGAQEEEVVSPPAAKKRGGRGRKRAVVESDKPEPAENGNQAEEEEVITAPKKSKKEVKAKQLKVNGTATNYDKLDFTLDKEFNLKISSWNVAGLRSWITKGGHEYLDHEKPDIFCLQEIKCSPDQIPDKARIPGYHPYWLCKPGGYAGVAIYSRIMPINVEYGIGDDEQDADGRIMTAEYEKFYLVVVYVPNAGRGLVTLPKRMRWDKIFQDYVTKLNEKKPVIIAGDMNVSHQEIDLANPKSNKRNAGFTQEERDGMTKLLSLGFVDTFRHLYPDKEKPYTFWTYMGGARARNVGWRLDYFILSEKLTSKVVDNVMRPEVLGSNHCPITLFLNL